MSPSGIFPHPIGHWPSSVAFGMKIALAQLNYVIGDFERNVFIIKENIRKAKQEKADLIVFSELAI